MSDNLLKNLKSENKELNISDIDLKSPLHQPSKDNYPIKLDRVLSSLIPELEGLDADV